MHARGADGEVGARGSSSVFKALDDGGESDFGGLLWMNYASPVISLQTLSGHSLQRLLDFEPKAINPTVLIVKSLKSAEVGTHFCGVG